MKFFTNTDEKLKIMLVIALLILGFVLRFTQLGFSHFYGDETKAFQLDSSIPFKEFLMNQRKGPVQFIVVAVIRNIFNAKWVFNEGFLRLPFALAGFLSIPVLYLLVKRRLGFWTALVSAFLFCTNGFYIAFSRTVQYQSFLILFGLLAMFFTDLSLEDRESSTRKLTFSALSGCFLGVAFLSHYDGVFFAIPIFFIWICKYISLKKSGFATKEFFIHLVFFIFFSLLLSLCFYLPYFQQGFFSKNTLGYLERRINYEKPQSSMFTYWVYNPFVLGFLPFIFAPIAFLKVRNQSLNNFLIILSIWLAVPLIAFEIIISSSGTHIQNYILPLLIITAFGLVKTIYLIKSETSRSIFRLAILIIFFLHLVTQIWVFIPAINSGYPWTNRRVQATENQLFLYGFPYNRGWKEIASYLEESNAKTFYTTDNDTIGEFYLKKLHRDLSHPEYLVHIFENQEAKILTPDAWLEGPLEKDLINEEKSFVYGAPKSISYRRLINRDDAAKKYELIKEIFIENKKVAVIYVRVE